MFTKKQRTGELSSSSVTSVSTQSSSRVPTVSPGALVSPGYNHSIATIPVFPEAAQPSAMSSGANTSLPPAHQNLLQFNNNNSAHIAANPFAFDASTQQTPLAGVNVSSNLSVGKEEVKEEQVASDTEKFLENLSPEEFEIMFSNDFVDDSTNLNKNNAEKDLKISLNDFENDSVNLNNNANSSKLDLSEGKKLDRQVELQKGDAKNHIDLLEKHWNELIKLETVYKNTYDKVEFNFREKTLAVNLDGNYPTSKAYSLSGYSDRERGNHIDMPAVIQKAEKLDHKFPMKEGKDKKYYASHAEKMRSLYTDDPIHVSRALCSDCLNYFQKEVNATGKYRLFRTGDAGQLVIFQANKPPVKILPSDLKQYAKSRANNDH